MGPGSVGLFLVFVFSMGQPINKVQCGNDWDVREGQVGKSLVLELPGHYGR